MVKKEAKLIMIERSEIKILLMVLAIGFLSSCFFQKRTNLLVNHCESKKVYYCADINNYILESLDQNNIPRLRFINSGMHFDTEKNGSININKFREYLEILRQTPRREEIFVIDWESQFINIVGPNKKDENIEKFATKIKTLISIGKEYFPKSKWGIYNIPISNYWKRDSIWESDCKGLIEVLKHCDVLYPSVYDFYKDDNKYAGKLRDSAYIVGNLELAFKLNEELNIPIYPFVWHRWHNSNSIRPLESIDESEFKRHVDIINNYQYKGKQVDGLVWWASDRYFSNINHKSIVKERNSFTDFEEYLSWTYLKYMSIIIQSVNNSCLNT